MVEGALGNTVLIGLWYVILFIFVPAICLHHLVREKRLVWRLAFYQIAGLTNLIFWGYLFSFLHIWQPFVLRLLMVYIPIALKVILDRKRLFAGILENFRDAADKTISRRLMMQRFGKWLKQKIIRFFNLYIRNHFLSLLILFAIAAFLVVYYGYFKLHYTTYATSDEATHLYWIHALMTGGAFPAGLYPHLMHFIAAVISSFLNISALYVNHYLSIVMVILLHFTLFCALKMLLKSKTAAIWGTGIFAIANLFVTGVRYQMTLPMEFAFIPMLMVLIFLAGYRLEKDKWNWWMIILSLVCTAQIHLTSALFALVFVAAYLIVFPRAMVRLKTFAALGLALVLTVLPFGTGLVLGYPIEQSMGWAVSLVENRDDYYEGNELSEQIEEPAEEETVRELTDTQKEWKEVHDLPSFGKYVIHLLTEDVVNSGKVSLLLYLLELFAFAYAIWRLIYERHKEEKRGLLVIPVIWLFAFLLHAVPKILGSTLADSGRMQIFLSLISALLFAVPVQAISDVLELIPGKRTLKENIFLILSVFGLCGCYFFGSVKNTDNLRYNFVIQSESFKLTDDVINHNVKDTWTVISPVNDLVGIRCYGYHYEIIDLLWQIEGGQEEFYIPTPDIYVVVEKAIPHFEEDETTFELAVTKNGKDLTEDRSDPVDPAFVDMSFDEIGLTNENRAQKAYYQYRQPTMSKLYYWMEKIKSTYPGEVSVYSEDENCVIYHITQDPYFLLDLAVDYR